VRFGEFHDTGLTASVNEGELGVSLLGMAYLSRFPRIEIAGEHMILYR
jgi:aspartyl protease family protein